MNLWHSLLRQGFFSCKLFLCALCVLDRVLASFLCSLSENLIDLKLLLINNIKSHFINHWTDSLNWPKKSWKSTFTSGGCGTRFGIFVFLALTMQICPSFQGGDEKPHVFIPNKIQTNGYTQQTSCSPFSHRMSLMSPRVPQARPCAGNGVCINHSQFFLIWQRWCGANDK